MKTTGVALLAVASFVLLGPVGCGSEEESTIAPAAGGGGAGAGGAGAQGGASSGGGAADGGGGIGPCAPLVDRVSTFSLSVVDGPVPTSWSDAFTHPPMTQLAVSPSGQAFVAWVSATPDVRVTAVDEEGQPIGADVVVPGSELRGFVAHDDAVALLVRRDQAFDLVRVGLDGTTEFDVRLVEGGDSTQTDMTFVGTYGHNGRLAWSGSLYAAYLGHSRNFGPETGVHQGDMLRLVDAAGQIQEGGWSWGCSHSDDVRLTFMGATGDTVAPVCVSDGYPAHGVVFKNGPLLFPDSLITPTYIPTQLGGLVSRDGALSLALSSLEGRDSNDIALIRFDGAGALLGDVVWLTSTPETQELSPRLASYGSGWLVSWAEDGLGAPTILAVVDDAGATIDPPVSIEATAVRSADLVTFPNGDVGWAYPAEQGQSIAIVRIRACAES